MPPSHEAIVNTMLPAQIEKPIPTRTVSTRTVPRPQNLNQASTGMDPAAAASATPAASVKLGPEVTALARKQQAMRQREQAIAEREKQLEERLAKAEKYSRLEAGVESGDYSGLGELKVDYNKLTKWELDRQLGEDPQAQKFNSLEEQIQALKKSQEDKATEEYEETVAAYRTEITSLIDAPEFQALKKFKETGAEGKEFSGVDIALQLILDSWEEDQVEVSSEEAVRLTKESLIERARKYSALMEEPVQEESKLPPPRAGSRTLTQQLQPAGVTKQPAKSLQHLSEAERYAEARRRVLERQQQGS